ncbi:type II toxin-antitoxin system RelE/ParE family toxin [Ottowia testudinis]|uniref:Type II toxin-antitoxin system RelE/ParE family toxin n=1 Tax=Ottowia testudinis TaxID=2816950 RepID=A0A975CI62_9BURK|nr:type II toxin-antitoxin system RelE/ParE family toxin [Ottowia testudinis]QTD43843.1 type II toxin-antitoxin system RelE/ParE family toxin [Ottowia testudinis]
MSMATLRMRAEAAQDVDDAIAHYLTVSDSPVAALGFIDALETALIHIRRQPGTGTPRYAHELEILGLRCWFLTRYPYAVFYFEQGGDVIDVWRVLHAQTNIPDWLRPG